MPCPAVSFIDGLSFGLGGAVVGAVLGVLFVFACWAAGERGWREWMAR